jgi:microcystin-dependent protein
MDPFVAEIRIFAGNFAPTGWALCDGQILPISQNTALFSLLGTSYGGDGRSTFGLPDLQGRAPLFWGQGPGLSNYFIGEQGGAETVTLLTFEMPAHSHNARGTNGVANQASPQNNVWAGAAQRPYAVGPVNTAMNASAILPAGSSMPHNNMPPFLALTFIIALQGIYPPRSSGD